MDYGKGKTVACSDSRFFSWRKAASEQQWEKDLLETGFMKKILEGSQYYCPLDQAASALRFLLEVGWKIIDYKAREVVAQTEMSLSLGLAGNQFVLKGDVRFGAHSAKEITYAKAYRKSELFIALGENSVGLLDSRAFPILREDLGEIELIQEGIAIPKRQLDMIEPLLQDEKIVKDPQITDLFTPVPAILSDFHGSLHLYQQKGVDFLAFLKKEGLHGLLADEMGLGKTVQVLAFFSTFARTKPILIVVPTSLLFHWRREIERFLPQEALYIHAGGMRRDDLPKSGIVLTSYAILRQDIDLISSAPFSCAVLDEAQVIKNPKSQVALAAYKLQADFRLALTGTPVENRIADLWSLFHFLMPQLLGDNLVFAAKKMRPFILRRRKDQIEHQLPPKVVQTIWVEMDEEQKSFYDNWAKKSRAGLIAKISLMGRANIGWRF